MLTKDDKNWLVENLVTRGEFNALHEKVETGFESVDSKLDTALNQLAAFTGTIADLKEEGTAATGILYRHDRNIQQLAKATRTTLAD